MIKVMYPDGRLVSFNNAICSEYNDKNNSYAIMEKRADRFVTVARIFYQPGMIIIFENCEYEVRTHNYLTAIPPTNGSHDFGVSMIKKGDK